MDRVKRCHCSCDSFRFKEVFDDKDTDRLYTNICRNCNHTLSEHLHLPGAEQ